MPDRLGTAYLSVATLSGIAFLLLAAKLVIGRTRSDARVVFFASIIHLPLILLVMVAETIVGLMVG
jgi:heme O synthase-like polyprenyltransferase